MARGQPSARRPKSKRRRSSINPLPQKRRREIVDEAALLMEERGFAAMSVRDLAGALVFSKANFYHHIESKEELLYEIFVETLQFAIRRIGEIVDSHATGIEKLRALIDFYMLLMVERRAQMLVWFKERAHLLDAHRKEVANLETEVNKLLTRLYEQGMREGSFRRIDVDVLRLAVFGMCFMLTKLRLNSASAAEVGRQVMDLLTQDIEVPAPTQPKARRRSKGRT